MSGDFFLDWATMAVSLFNTILLLWLGLTVLLNAERRSWGIWLAGGALLMGGGFFLSHSVILGYGLNYYGWGVNFWWYLGWIPVVLSPFAWYVVMLWYAGYWEDRQSPVYRRHRLWFMMITLITGVMAAMFIFTNPLPSYAQVARLNLTATPSVRGIPVLILVYPLYILACIGLALDALLRPGPTIRVMGHLARLRARPWLIAASTVLILVSLLVGAVMLWVILNAHQYNIELYLARTVAWFDLVIATLIAIAIGLTGQAVVSYEVFTGRTLPRRGLLRYWHRAFVLALGYSATVSLSLTLNLRQIYSMLLSTFLMVVFYALLSWRSYAEREHFISNLRPFVASQQLYEQLLSPLPNAGETDVGKPFYALSEDVLGARLAHLVPLGPLAPLFGPPLTWPNDATLPLSKLPEISAQFSSPQTLCIPLAQKEYSGIAWAVPLWNERGLSGILLLGEKQDGGLYTQEEIEFARTASERLMDIQASAEIARRLMALQRRQLAESQVLDRQARRVLHDDVLPYLHTVMLTLSGEESGCRDGSSDVLALLGEAHHQIADLMRDMPTITAPEVTQRGLVGALKQVAQGELKHAFDEVTWQIAPEAARNIERIPLMTADVLFYAAREAIRNAARHARDERSGKPLNLRVSVDWDQELEIVIEDNGVGIEGTRHESSRGGQGLALHSTMLAVVGGALAVESTPGVSTCVRLSLPLEDIDGSYRESTIS